MNSLTFGASAGSASAARSIRFFPGGRDAEAAGPPVSGNRCRRLARIGRGSDAPLVMAGSIHRGSITFQAAPRHQSINV